MKQEKLEFMTDKRSYWYNFRTEEYDYVSSEDFTHETAQSYISQNPSAQAIFEICHKELGMPILESMLKVLKAQAGVKDESTAI